MARIRIQFIWILCLVNASQQILPVPKFIQNKVNEFKHELGSQWETYEAFKNNYTNLVILGITDPTKLLQKLNLTLTVPQKSGDDATQSESSEKAKAESLEKVESDESAESESAEDVSYELINQRRPANRQGLPLPGVPGVPVTEGLSPVFTAVQAILLVPFIIANLVMAIVMFGINVSLRADSPRLTQIRQEQVEALAALAGVPAELVSPPGEDAGAAALARADSKEEDSSENLQSLKNVQKCRSEGRSMGSEERLNPIERLVDAVETLILAPTAHQITTLVGLAVFWFLGTTGLEYLGLDTTLTLGIGVAALLWLLTPSKDPKLIDLSSFKSVNRRGKLCATEDDDEELRSLVEKSIRRKFK